MTLEKLLSHLRQKDVRLWVEDDRLRYKGPSEVVTPEILHSLQSHKQDIIALIRNADVHTQPAFMSLRSNLRPQNNLPLTFAQEPLWFLHQLQSENASDHISSGLRLVGPLDFDALERSFNEIIRRHEILRTVFKIVEGQPVQVIRPPFNLKIPVIDLQDVPRHQREDEAQSTAIAEARMPFDLSIGSLLRARLLLLGDDETILLLTMHHIISDGLSGGIFFRELALLYEAFASGKPSPLAELPIQYGDFAYWQRQWMHTNKLDSLISYWKQKLTGSSLVLDLPTDKPRPAVQSHQGAKRFLVLPAKLYGALKSLSKREGCTVFMTLAAAFQTLLYRYADQDDLLIGIPVANRNRPELEKLIGLFLNMVVLRGDLSGDPSFRELLVRVRNTTLEALAHQDLPFEALVKALKPERDLSRNPVFQVMLELSPDGDLELPGLDVSSFAFDSGTAQFDLALHIYEGARGLRGFFEYNTDLFDPATIERLSRHFERLLHGIVADPERRISELLLLTDAERHQLIVEWNDTSVEYPQDRCIHELFEEIVASRGTRDAVALDGKTLTYNDLNARANQLANYLIKSGVKPETYVGIYVERSLDLLVGLLGIMKAGATYVPMDPAFPPDRLAYMMEDAGISILVTQEHLSDIFPRSERKVICIDAEWDMIVQEDTGNPNLSLDSHILAYTIYTSGSTGKPKGVMIEHQAVVNFLISMQQEPGFNEDDVLVAVTTISFDIAVLELFLPLITGGKVVIANKNETIDGKLLLTLIEHTGATILQATPATWKLMIEAGWEKTPNLKMLCGGEPLPRDLANNMLKRGGELWNMYGPTETTIWSSVQRIEPGDSSILIGPPIANTQFYVVDKEMEPVPIGVAGELLIGGDGLSRGYLNRPNLTAERFIEDPFSNSGARIYRTGDLARYRSNGEVEFLGRLDFQVKVRGFRIELGEIETILKQHSTVGDVVVLVGEDSSANKQLVAYIIPADAKELKVSDLRKFLREKLPEYMIPSFFVKMDEFPLTPNAKIDRKAFPDPDKSKLESESEHIAPRDELELQLAAIWQKALGVKKIGINDNFFDLGGHSLLAARVFAQMEKKIGVNLPLAMLFQAPTIGQIADVLKDKDWKPTWSSLVPIQVRGTKPPLFLIHGAEGNVLLYKNLSYHLGDDQPVYGLQSQGLDGRQPLQTNFISMAENYIKEIRSVQPEGPYCLGGYCLGGTIALEIAKQLKGAGDEVLLLAMFESYNIHDIPKSSSFFLNKFHRIQNIYFQLRNLTLSQSGERYKYFKEKATVEFSRFKIQFNILLSKIFDKLIPTYGLKYQHLLIGAVNDRAQVYYNPGKYNGKITLFKTKTNFYRSNDQYFGWDGVSSEGVEIINMPCYPRGLLTSLSSDF